MIACNLQSLARGVGAFFLVAAGLFASSAQAVNLTPLPPYLTETKGSPMVMLNLSRDHQLSYKAYNEFSDLDGDGTIEKQYSHSYSYYGYFDNERCYTYNTTSNTYVPSRKVDATTNYCNYGGAIANEWSGNFLNWATMTRMDVVRRILYGGMRSTDSGTSTVLERAYLPTDAHSFAKYYNNTDISKLTPFSGTNEITLCNATFKNGSNQYSHNPVGPPALLVANGNYSLWNSNERWQCYWGEQKNPGNGNLPAVTGLNAGSTNPSSEREGLGTGISKGTYTVRVEVCKTGLDGAATGVASFTNDENSRCKLYPSGAYKPIGLLQKYGERNEAAFGLITGSYSKNISGGVLRKNVSSFANEVNVDNGQFTNVDGIVSTLNKIRIYGYDYDDGTYTASGGDNCNYGLIGLTEGRCGSWGNPIGEMYLESLRYLAGAAAPTAAFTTTGGKDAALGLTVATWSDPFAASTVAAFGDRTCRRSSVINFNASVTTYDGDQWTGASDVAGLSSTKVTTLTNDIGAAEGLYATGKKWPVGRTATDTNNLCSDKTISALATSLGICPEAPTGYGSFLMAGAAQYAHTNRIRTDITAPASNLRAFKVDTYGVALATSTPRIKIPVPNQAGKYVVIQPAMRLTNDNGQGGGALVDFRVVSQSPTAGKFVVQWEDSEQGGDYDQDMWGTLEYAVNSATGSISVTTYVAAESTSDAYKMGFGYAIAGTNGKDGVHFHSGINGLDYTDPVGIGGLVTPTTYVNATGGCKNCAEKNPATTAVYSMTGVSGEALQDPMWYAAKYGGFDRTVVPSYTSGTALPTAAWDSKKADGTAGSDGIPDNYFYAIDPAELERSLNNIFTTILRAGGAAPAAATTSRTQAGGYVYASTHSIKTKAVGSDVDADASGQFLRYGFDDDGIVKSTSDWDAGAKLTVDSRGAGWQNNRKILSLSDTAPIAFNWTSLSTAQKNALKKNPATGATDSDTRGSDRLAWLRGDNTNETTAGGMRIRPTTKLGAIINSTPWYVGTPAAGYTNAQYGGGYGAFRTGIVAANGNTARSTVFVGANDGMLHAFDGNTGKELFAYVPRALYTTSGSAPYSKLSAITAKDFALSESTERMTVDGSVMAADVKIGSTWSTYLFGAFGRGARGVYALDVTKPNLVSEASPANVVKWEFTEAADSDMGYITGRTNGRSNGQPFQTGYMANGKWAAIYGNGYNSTSGRAALFILFANGPASAASTTWTRNTEYIKIMTPVVTGDSGDNGLASPTAVDTNNDGVIDRIYAGDLKGNVWRFDVSNADPTQWKVFNETAGAPVPLYKATTVVGVTTVPQPITTPIVPFPHPKGGYQLFFATGKSLESNDYPMSSVYPNTMYGIYDKPGNTTTLTTGKTDLVSQTISFTSGVRFITANPVDYGAAGKLGWYANLPVSSEGVVFNPFAEDTARINVRSLAPSATSDGCRYDGTSFDMVLNPIYGIAIPGAVPGVTTAGAIGSSNLNFFEGSSGGQFRVPPSPPSTPGGPPSPPPPLCEGQCLFRSIISAGDGTLKTVERCGACTAGRLTWREIFRNR